MVWRAYYTIQDAAEELSRHFNDRYSISDVIHYGANGLVRLCLYNLNSENVFVERVDCFNEEYFTSNGQAAVGDSIICPDFIVIPSNTIRAAEKNKNETLLLKAAKHLIADDNTLIPKCPKKFEETYNALNQLGEFSPVWRFNVFPFHFLDDYNKNASIAAEILDNERNVIEFKVEDLYITLNDFESLKKTIQEKISGRNKQVSVKTTNKQTEIIAALSVLFTKTDCTKPYEAAETILQEWQRHETTLGKPPSKETLAQYISEGLNRIAP